MAGSIVPEGARPCLWMSAGLVAWKLCDRDFDCDHCPLDAALHGAAPPEGHWRDEARPAEAALDFPDDRAYGGGHTWVRGDAHRCRLGVDALAAALVARPRSVRLPPPGRELPAGGTAAEIEVAAGWLAVSSPLAGRIAAVNELLSAAPERLARDPYGEGWLLELEGEAPQPEPDDRGNGGRRNGARRRRQFPGLRGAADHRLDTLHDLAHFRRRIALHLLSGAGDLGATLPDGGVPLTDLRLILGGERWLDLVRDLLH
jgi:glycine cleavage system H protein